MIVIAHETPREDRPAVEIPDSAEGFDDLDGFVIVVKGIFTAGDAAVDVIDRFRKKQAGVSRHETSSHARTGHLESTQAP